MRKPPRTNVVGGDSNRRLPIATKRHHWKLRALVCLVLALATLTAYSRTFKFGFVDFDDDRYVTQNSQVKGGLSADNLRWAFTSYHASNWHPLTWLSLMLDTEIGGGRPQAYHVTNVVLHTASALLLFLLLELMTGLLWPSAFVAALFGLHPLHVESVAWIAERKDVLSAFFWILTLLAYVAYARRQSVLRYGIVVVLFAVGLMAKPMLVALPIVMLLLDYWPLGRLQSRSGRLPSRPDPGRVGTRPLRILLIEKVPLIALAVGSSILTFKAQSAGGTVGSLDLYPMGVRVANALVAYTSYIGKMFWPRDLAISYPHPDTSLPEWAVIGSGLALVLATVLAIHLRRGKPYLAVGWLWYVLTLIPVIGLVQVGVQAMADRYTYIPLIGVFVIVAYGARDLVSQRYAGRATVAALGVLAVALVLLLGAGTYAQTGVWRSNLALFSHAVNVTSGNALAHYDLAQTYIRMGKMQRARPHIEEAIRIDPCYAAARSTYASFLMQEGKLAQAVKQCRIALRARPDFADAHCNLGLALMNLGDYDEAQTELRKAIHYNPDLAEAYFNLAILLRGLGKAREALPHFEIAARIAPGNVLFRNTLAVTLAGLGERERALEEFSAALRVMPDDVVLIRNRAAALADLGRFDEALQDLREALARHPPDPTLTQAIRATEVRKRQGR